MDALRTGLKWSFQDYHFKGYSIAGITTSIYFENAKVCFDVGQGLPFHLSAKYFLLTHLHADHGMGIPYVLSQRAMMNLPKAQVYVPAEHVDALREIIIAWQKLEGYTYEFEIYAAPREELIPIDKRYAFKSFKTCHRINSNGYLVYEKKKKLNEEFWQPLVAFTGDTTIDFLDSNSEATNAKILFIESTFIDDKKNIADAKKWGHTHLDEIVSHIDKIKSEVVCLIHFSGRYKTNEIKNYIEKKFKPSDLKRICIFPRPF